MATRSGDEGDEASHASPRRQEQRFQGQVGAGSMTSSESLRQYLSRTDEIDVEDLENAALKIQNLVRKRKAQKNVQERRHDHLKAMSVVASTVFYLQDTAEVRRKAAEKGEKVTDMKSKLEKLREKRQKKQKHKEKTEMKKAQSHLDHLLVSEDARHEHLEMSEASVLKAKQIQMENVKLPWTNSNQFSMVIGLFIVLNAACLGLEADFGKDHPKIFLIIEHCFTCIFFCELLAHLKISGPKMYFSDHMNFVDCGIVLISVVDMWIIRSAGVEADLRMTSIFRMFRLFRLARLLRLFRIFKELTLLVTGFIASVRTLGWALLFLVIMVYCFALFARQVLGNGGYEFNEENVGDAYSLFGTVDRSMLTLFVCLTEGCGMDIVQPTVWQSPFLIIFWSIFIFFTTYGLLNLIVGCFCEQAMKSAADTEREMLANRDEKRMAVLRNMQAAFNSMDKDGTGTISKREFTMGIISNEKVHDAFSQLGLEEEENLFDRIDADKEGVISFQQFFEGALLIMKGQETAKAKDLVPTHLTTMAINRRIKKVEHKVMSIKRHVKEIHEHQVGNQQQNNSGKNALVKDIIAVLRAEGLLIEGKESQSRQPFRDLMKSPSADATLSPCQSPSLSKALKLPTCELYTPTPEAHHQGGSNNQDVEKVLPAQPVKQTVHQHMAAPSTLQSSIEEHSDHGRIIRDSKVMSRRPVGDLAIDAVDGELSETKADNSSRLAVSPVGSLQAFEVVQPLHVACVPLLQNTHEYSSHAPGVKVPVDRRTPSSYEPGLEMPVGREDVSSLMETGQEVIELSLDSVDGIAAGICRNVSRPQDPAVQGQDEPELLRGPWTRLSLSGEILGLPGHDAPEALRARKNTYTTDLGQP